MRKIVGIVGGVGPMAGVDLHRRIIRLTVARSDSEHLEVLLHTNPLIPDRTAFLLGRTSENPARQIIRSVDILGAAGCRVVGIPCNTAHAPEILDPVSEHIARSWPGMTMARMVAETVSYIRAAMPGVRRVGILATTGTIISGIYRDALARYGIEAIVPDQAGEQDKVMAAIYDRSFGIKAVSDPVDPRARGIVMEAASGLAARGAQAVILGCTELPLAADTSGAGGVPFIIPTEILAAAMVRLATSKEGPTGPL
ncbi:MAG: amino acid racemase [Planctomycetota bacterium]|nr:amino acid racemase [Planctomycetota bacterium]